MKISAAAFALLFAASLSAAQTLTDRLIVSEVYLDAKNPSKNWIEIYNPTESSQTIEGFRLSYIRSLNILPEKTGDEDGYIIKPNGFMLVCSDRNLLDASVPESVKVIEVSDLKTIRNGGFLAVYTRTSYKPVSDAVRFGKPELSTHIAMLSECRAIPFSENGESYSRLSFTELVSTTATPGHENMK
jgi:hypothetical protein